MTHTPRRAGFTLAGLLVVLAILGLLLALALPAILRLRAAAERAGSTNHLKQIGIACHGYHDTNGRFPPGTDKDRVSVFVHLLPYVEQNVLHKQFTDKGRKAVEGERVPTYQDPRDKREVVPGLAPTSYLFNAGNQFSLKENNGICYHDSKVAITSITDGTSNTALAGQTLPGDGGEGEATVARRFVRYKADALGSLGEDSGVKDFAAGKNLAGDRCASWADGRFLQTLYTGTARPNDKAPDVDCGGVGGISALRSLDNTVLMLMCDASTHPVSVKVSIATWRRAHQRDDGEPLGDDFE
jgi:Tfp pilus assembly protein PilE